MSRLLGIVNPLIPTDDPQFDFKYWLWRANGIIPPAAEWDYERLTVATCPGADGNLLLAVTGPPTEKYRDGVFLRMHVNPELKPTAKLADTDANAPPPVDAWTPLEGMR